jgi:hypothetical protein
MLIIEKADAATYIIHRARSLHKNAIFTLFSLISYVYSASGSWLSGLLVGTGTGKYDATDTVGR